MHIDEFLKIAVESNASDLHLKAGTFPIIRVHGKLKSLIKFPKLSPENTLALVGQITSDYQKEVLKKELDLDLAYSLEGFGRFRGSIFQQRRRGSVNVCSGN